jgi:hypothetical protein
MPNRYFVALQHVTCEVLRRRILAAIATTAMAIPSVTHAAAVSCLPSTITAVPPAGISGVLVDLGHGHVDMISGPTFSPAPGGCPGFTATNFSFFYTASQIDNGQPVIITVAGLEVLSFADNPMVTSFVSADGGENYSDDLTLSNIMVDTFVDDRRSFGAFAETGPLPSKSSFSIDSDMHSGIAPLFQSLPLQNLHFELEIDLLQGNVVPGEFFFIDFPGSIISAIVPVPTPEPSSFVLIASALGGLAAMRRRKGRRRRNRHCG